MDVNPIILLLLVGLIIFLIKGMKQAIDTLFDPVSAVTNQLRNTGLTRHKLMNKNYKFARLISLLWILIFTYALIELIKFTFALVSGVR